MFSKVLGCDELTIKGKPTIDQLLDWLKKGTIVNLAVIDFEYGGLYSHCGKIAYVSLQGDHALLQTQVSTYGIYLRNIISYSFIPEFISIYLPANSDSPNKIILRIDNESFHVDRKKLSERVSFFDKILMSKTCEVSQATIDLSSQLTVNELKTLLTVVSVGNSFMLDITASKAYLSAANKISDVTMINDANSAIKRNVQMLNRNLHHAVIANHHIAIENLIEKGAEINNKFGHNARGKNDYMLDEGPNDTPLTYAVKIDDVHLAEFLLKCGADPDISFKGSHLIEACQNFKVRMVKLLLRFGANPTIGGDPIFNLFAIMNERDLNENTEATKRIIKVLLEHHYHCDPYEMVTSLRRISVRESIIDAFIKIWKEMNSTIDKAYKNGAIVGAFADKLPAEVSCLIGGFLNRTAGGRLAQVSRSAVKTAKEEQNNHRVRIAAKRK